MRKKMSTAGLARFAARRPWSTIGLWLLVVAFSLFAAGKYMSSALSPEERPLNNPESYRAEQLLKKGMPGYDKPKETLVIDSKLKVTDAEYRAYTERLQKNLDGLGGKVIEQTLTYYQTGSPAMVSKDQKTSLMQVVLAGKSDKAIKNIDKINRAIDKADTNGKFDAWMVGNTSMSKAYMEISEKDLQTGEMYGILVAIVILVLVFGTVGSAFIPLILSIVAIITAVGATALLGQQFEFSFFIVNMITMMGLAVGIDYSLFIVSRFREELEHTDDKVEAIVNAGSTAGRAVFFSGLTVILALVGMLIIPFTVFTSLASGAMLVVFFAIIASLTLLPAILSILGRRVNSLRLPIIGKSKFDEKTGETLGFWHRVAVAVMHRPVLSLSVALAILLFSSSFYRDINIGSSMSAETLPDSLEQKKAFKLLEDKFSSATMNTAMIVIDDKVSSSEVQEGVARLKKDLGKDKDFGPVALTSNKKGDLGLIELSILSEPSSEKAKTAARELRNDYIPDAFGDLSSQVFVGGQVPSQLDFIDTIDRYTPVVFGIVLSLSFILLTMVFRSIVVPIKAILMNLLSVGAAYGLIVLVFQKGVGNELFGFKQIDVVEAWIPLFLFSVLFGLSMDYHVFLLSRIKEHFDESGDNTESVAFGLSATGRIITGAAVIMVAVFGGFAVGDLVSFQQMGFGLAVAVLLDATIVRSVLVPAGMKLLGRNNWYLPRALEWLPRINFEGTTKVSERKNQPYHAL